jgi:hypothetical protein
MTPEDIILALRQAGISSVSAVMRVEIPGNVGYFFLLHGEVVHASTLELTGEDAARAMLRWGRASLSFCERRWPSERSVFRSWAELTPSEDSDPPAFEEDEPEPESHELPTPLPPVDVHFPSSLGIRQALGRAEFKNALRISVTGNITDSRGSTAHLKPIVRSSVTLGDSLGAALGLGPLIAAEANAPSFHRLLARSSEDTSAVETSGGSGLALARAFLKL